MTRMRRYQTNLFLKLSVSAHFSKDTDIFKIFEPVGYCTEIFWHVNITFQKRLKLNFFAKFDHTSELY